MKGECEAKTRQLQLQHQVELDASLRECVRRDAEARASFEAQTREKADGAVKEVEAKFAKQLEATVAANEDARKRREAEVVTMKLHWEGDKASFEASLREQYNTTFADHEKHHASLLQTVKQDHDTERTRMASEFQQAREEFQRRQAEFEHAEREKLDRQLEAMRAQMQKERDALVEERRLKDVEDAAARTHFEEKTRDHYTGILREREESAAHALQERDAAEEVRRVEMEKERVAFEEKTRKDLEGKLGAREAELAAVLAQREALLAAADLARRADEHTRDLAREKDRVAFEQRCKDEFEKQAAALRAELDVRRSELEESAVADRAQKKQAELHCHTMELRLKKFRHATLMWRIDFQKETKIKYERLISTLETRAKQEEDALQRKRQEELEKRRVEEIVLQEEALKKKMAEESASRERAKSDELRAQSEASAEDARRRGLERLQSMRRSIQELWTVLDADPAERAAFLWECELHGPYSDPVLTLYQREIARLNEQLPLMETITKREFLKYQINEFNRGATDPTRLFVADPGRLNREDIQRKEYFRELDKLNQALVKGLTGYEKKHNQMFLYKGRQYLEIMTHDVQDAERELELENIARTQQQQLGIPAAAGGASPAPSSSSSGAGARASSTGTPAAGTGPAPASARRLR